MASHQRWVKDLGLPQHELQLLSTHNILTARDLLTQSALDLVERLNVPLSQAQRILQHAAMQLAPPFVNALELHSTLHLHSVKLLTGLPALDAALRIGVPPAAITELVGPAGVGKSQFCYTLALQVALPRPLGGLGCPIIYLDTEGKFSSDRLQEMVTCRVLAAPPAAIAAAAAGAGTSADDAAAGEVAGGGQALSAEQVIDQILNRVLVVRADTPEELMKWLNLLDDRVPRLDIKLVVLDSVAALLRTEFGGGEASALAARGELLGQQAAILKAVAEAHRVPVVVTNQVTARMTGPAVHSFQQQVQPLQAAASHTAGGEGAVSAALGTKWAHAVNVRLMLERRETCRVITIAKSPLSANVAVEYVITPGGVQQAADDAGGQPAAALVAPHSALNIPIANAPPR